MSEVGYLLLSFIVLHAVSEWRWKKTLEKLEDQSHKRWQRLASLLSGTEDTIEFEGLDPHSRTLVDQARKQGYLDGDED